MIKWFNRTLSEALFKLEKIYNWNKFVRSTLMVYNTSQQNSMKMISYFLIYSRIAKLLIKKKVLSRSILLDRVITLVHKLPLFRESARIAIKKAQDKMRQNYPI